MHIRGLFILEGFLFILEACSCERAVHVRGLFAGVDVHIRCPKRNSEPAGVMWMFILGLFLVGGAIIIS